MDRWQEFRLQFPVTARRVYLDHAAVAPLPERCRGRIAAYLDELSWYGASHYPAAPFAVLQRARELGASILGTEPEHVFVVRSTTQGLGIAATGLPAAAGDNVVIVEGEFPANVRPWLPLRRRGIEVRMVPQRGGRVLLDDLAAAVDGRTAALSISFVQYHTGYRADLAAVGQLCREHDALFVVDGIQGVGVLPIDVERLGVDLLAADSHKWMLGPEGVGLGYASPRALERIEPALEGWMALRRPFDFSDPEQPLKDTAARYEEGAYNFAGLYGMTGSLELLLSVGVEHLERRVLALTDHLAEALAGHGWTVLSPRDREAEKSGIVQATREGVDFEALPGQLQRRGFQVSVRGGALRVSPHGYNTVEELDGLVDALP